MCISKKNLSLLITSLKRYYRLRKIQDSLGGIVETNPVALKSL